MIVRPETPLDRAAIRAVVIAAFAGIDEADLVDRLRRDGDMVFSVVALVDEIVVGHAALSRMGAPFRALGLAPVAVLPDRQRTGIGSRLVRHAIDLARAGGWDAIFVVGDPGYYSRFGFDPKLARGFASPYAGPHLMALALGRKLPLSGTVAYPAAFGA